MSLALHFVRIGRYEPVVGIAALIAILSALSLSGCASLLTRDDYEVYHAQPVGQHIVETLELEELSQSEPVTVAQATAEIEARLEQLEEPRETIELSLAEVRAATLTNNLDLNVELVSPSIFAESIGVEEAQFEPFFFGSASTGVIDRPAVIVDGTGLYAKQVSYEAGIEIPLRTGGTVTVRLPVSKYDDLNYGRPDSRDAPELIDPQYQAGAVFSISQPLLRNAGIRANTHAIRVAKYQRDIADARTKLEAIRILAEADRAYWVLYATRRERDVSQQQYELASQQLEEARQRVAAGASPEIEIMRAESGVARRLEAIIIAETSVRQAEREMKRIINRDDLPLRSATEIVTLTDPNPLGLDLDADALAELAVTNRMETLELELRMAIDESRVDFERNSMLPDLTLDYSYGTNGLGDSYHDALRGAGNSRYADYSVGLTAQIPIGNQAAKSRWRQARLQRLRRMAEKDQLDLAIRQEVRDVLDRLTENWQRIIAAGQEVVLAGRTWEAERRQFEVGLRTSTEVLEAAARLAGAQSREIRALALYEISLVDIAVATGSLLGKDQIIWSPTGLD